MPFRSEAKPGRRGADANPGWRRIWWLLALIFLFNAALVGRLFSVDRLVYKGSIEGAFIGLARFLARHPNPFGWYPFWYGGTPAAFTYTPALHYLHALLIRLFPQAPPGQVYHAVSAVIYSLGPASAACMAYFFTRRPWASFGAGMLSSVWTPALWLIPALRADAADFHAPVRLQVLAKYGEAPHIASLTLLPLAVCALWGLAQKKGFRRVFLAALLLACIVLINWIGAFALASVWLCVLLAAAGRPAPCRQGWLLRYLSAPILAFSLAVFWITPGFIRTIARNAQTVNGHYEYRASMILLLAGALTGLAAVRWLFLALPQEPYLCFLALAAFVFAYVTLAFYWLGWSTIPQPHRYVPEMDLFLALLVCEALRLARRDLAGRLRWAAPAAASAVALLAAHQSRHYVRQSYWMLRPARTGEWVEYKLDRWLGEHAAPHDRAFALGSEGMNLNSWFDVCQVKGWFDPGARNPLILHFSYQIGAGTDGPTAVALLKILAARYVVVHTARSSAAYHDFSRPEKFLGLLPAVYRPTPEETIYEVPGVRLAKLVQPGELAAGVPQYGGDLKPLARYAAALDDGARPPLETRWFGPNTLEVHGNFPAGFLVSLRVSWADGWRASQRGERIAAGPDRLGFLVLHPRPETEGRLRLEYAGDSEQRLCGWISLCALLAAVLLCLHPAARGRGDFAPGSNRER